MERLIRNIKNIFYQLADCNELKCYKKYAKFRSFLFC